MLSLLLLLSMVLGASVGAVSIPPRNVAAILVDRLPGIRLSPVWTADEVAIIMHIRLPRVVTAMVVGAALAAAGVIFQGLLRNPMADPYIIGTSGGAGLGATIAFILLPAHVVWHGFTLLSLLAFAGALGAVLLVYHIARVGPRTPIVTLLLAGFALSSVLAATMSFLMLASEPGLRRILLWLMGGLFSSNWDQLAVVIPIVIAGIAGACFLASDLNAFLLGEEQAAYLGVEVEQRKLILLTLGSLLTGSAVSISGLIGFVGLVIPHVTRLIFGPDHRLLLPASALVGALFLVLADLVARLILAPAEVPVGIITALIGAPFFIYLLRRSKKEYSF